MNAPPPRRRKRWKAPAPQRAPEVIYIRRGQHRATYDRPYLDRELRADDSRDLLKASLIERDLDDNNPEPDE